MGNLVATPQWVDVPYFEQNAVLTGGPACPDNIPIQALLDRTQYLKDNGADKLGIQKSAYNSAADTGAANAYVVDLAPALAALVDMLVVRFTVKTANTGPSTLNVNSLGAKTVKGLSQAALQGGELYAGGKATVIYSASQNAWILLSCTGGKLPVAAATASEHAVNLGQFDAVIGTFGRQRYPTGLIKQWGITASSSSSSDVPVVFSLAFPNAVRGIYLSAGTASAPILCSIGSVSAGGFSYSSWSLSGTRRAADQWYYMAIGN